MLSKKKKIKEAAPIVVVKPGVLPGKATGKTKGKDIRK